VLTLRATARNSFGVKIPLQTGGTILRANQISRVFVLRVVAANTWEPAIETTFDVTLLEPEINVELISTLNSPLQVSLSSSDQPPTLAQSKVALSQSRSSLPVIDVKLQSDDEQSDEHAKDEKDEELSVSLEDTASSDSEDVRAQPLGSVSAL
jgi:hypothetical protein